MPSMPPGRPSQSRLRGGRDLVDLVCRMAGTLVRAHDGFLAWRLRETEDHAGLRIAPCLLEVGILLALHFEVLLMGLHQLFRGDALHVPMHVHVLWHRHSLPIDGPQCLRLLL